MGQTLSPIAIAAKVSPSVTGFKVWDNLALLLAWRSGVLSASALFALIGPPASEASWMILDHHFLQGNNQCGNNVIFLLKLCNILVNRSRHAVDSGVDKSQLLNYTSLLKLSASGAFPSPWKLPEALWWCEDCSIQCMSNFRRLLHCESCPIVLFSGWFCPRRFYFRVFLS